MGRFFFTDDPEHDIQQILISPETTILKAVELIDENGVAIVLVTDTDRRLLGTVTDGDVRRGLLRGTALSEPVSKVMNTTPKVVRLDRSASEILSLMTKDLIRQIPVLGSDDTVVGLEVIDDLLRNIHHKPNWVMLMAGGKGTRLMPLTKDVPKPLIQVGGKPILETILDRFIADGFSHFIISINYLGNMVRDYFGNGSRWGVEIRYVEEEKPLGTAGALTLLEPKPELPIIVMNGDLLTTVSFGHLLDFHNQGNSMATLGVRSFQFKVPYGVVELEGNVVQNLEEKPTHSFFVSAGIYVLEPEILDQIPEDTFYDMPQLLRQSLADGEKVGAFPIREYWMDIGQQQQLDQAVEDYKGLFD